MKVVKSNLSPLKPSLVPCLASSPTSQSAHAFQSHRTLVLNADYKPFKFPLQPLNAEDTIKGMFLDRYDVVEWTDLVAHSPNLDIRLPSVVAVREYIPEAGLYGVPSCNLEHLFIRDQGLCQYTGNPVSLNSTHTSRLATIDHVVPRSRGGLVEWRNVVLASSKANNEKANRTLQEAGLTLPTPPWEPRGADLLYLWLTEERVASLPASWLEFLQIKPTPALLRVLDRAA